MSCRHRRSSSNPNCRRNAANAARSARLSALLHARSSHSVQIRHDEGVANVAFLHSAVQVVHVLWARVPRPNEQAHLSDGEDVCGDALLPTARTIQRLLSHAVQKNDCRRAGIDRIRRLAEKRSPPRFGRAGRLQLWSVETMMCPVRIPWSHAHSKLGIGTDLRLTGGVCRTCVTTTRHRCELTLARHPGRPLGFLDARAAGVPRAT